MDIQELLRQLRTGDSNRHIARQMRIDRRTVKRYRQWAQAHDLLTGPPPPLEELQALAEKTLSSSPPPQKPIQMIPPSPFPLRTHWQKQGRPSKPTPPSI